MIAMFKKHSSRLKQAAIALVLMACSHAAMAQVSCWTNGPTTFNNYPPANIAIPRDSSAPVGTVLWTGPNNNSNNVWGCNLGGNILNGAGDGFVFGSKVTPWLGSWATGATSSATLAANSKVYQTAVPGVGVVMSMTTYLWTVAGGTSSMPGWLPWLDAHFNGPDGSWTHGPVATGASGAQIAIGVAHQMAFVKTGPISPGTLGAGTVAQGAAICVYRPWGHCNSSFGAVNFNMSQVNFTVLQCTTPDVTVNLGNHDTPRFTGPGSTTAPVNFNINVNGCPPGISGVWYGFNYPAESFRGDTANGIINLDSSSTARGVAIQLLDANGNPAPMDTWFGMAGYGTGGGNYQIPMKARYIQRAATVSPGTANSYIWLAMHYH